MRTPNACRVDFRRFRNDLDVRGSAMFSSAARHCIDCLLVYIELALNHFHIWPWSCCTHGHFTKPGFYSTYVEFSMTISKIPNGQLSAVQRDISRSTQSFNMSKRASTGMAPRVTLPASSTNISIASSNSLPGRRALSEHRSCDSSGMMNLHDRRPSHHTPVYAPTCKERATRREIHASRVSLSASRQYQEHGCSPYLEYTVTMCARSRVNRSRAFAEDVTIILQYLFVLLCGFRRSVVEQ